MPVQATVPVQEQAPVAAPQTQRVVHEDVQAPHNVMTTITVSALMGGIAGLLVGGAIYYLADNQEHAARIGIWAAGGVLVGTGVGIVQVAADESRANTAVSQVWSSESGAHLPAGALPDALLVRDPGRGPAPREEGDRAELVRPHAI